MVKMYSSVLKDKATLLIVLLALSAPLFNLRIVASITIFDIFTLLACAIFLSRTINYKTVLLLCLFVTSVLVSEWSGLLADLTSGEKKFDSLNILFRYLILLFVMPYLSYKLFYSDSRVDMKIDLFYNSLISSFFCVLVFNIYAIYFQLEDYFLFQRFCSIYENPNTAALVLNLMSILFLFNTRHPIFLMRLFSYVSIPLTLVSLVVTGSYSGYIIQSIILSIFLIKTANFKVVIFIGFVVAALISFDLSDIDEESQVLRGLSRFAGLVTIISSDDDASIRKFGSADERMKSIESSLEELVTNPSYLFSGIGFGNVEALVESNTGYRTSIHLSYLQLMISIGGFGTIVYLFIFLRIFGKIKRYFVGNLAIQSILLLLTYLFSGIFVPHTYMSFYFAPIFPLLGLYGVNRNHG